MQAPGTEESSPGRDELLRQAAVREILRGKTLADRIRFLRTERRWTQGDLADEMKQRGLRTGKRTVAGWEGGATPQGHQRPALAAILGVDEKTLFND